METLAQAVQPSRWVGAAKVLFPAALAIAVIVFLVVRFTGQSSEAPPPAPQASAQAVGNQDLLTPAARQVAEKFVMTAGFRQNTGASWALLDPTFAGKSEFSRRTWAKGNIPVQPVTFPRSQLKDMQITVGPSVANELTLEMLLVPRKGKAEQYEIGLHKRGQKWLVDYWMTRYVPGFRKPPK
jgi:hypothetical protein